MNVEYHCPPSTQSGGIAARLDAPGSLSLVANDLELAVFTGPPGQMSLLIYGPDAVQIPFSHGTLCVCGGSVGVVRLLPVLPLDAQGHGVRQLDLSQPPLASGVGQVMMGSTWSFQAWYRDSAAGAGTSNLTDAARLTFQP